ncbi:hypothetical protein [Ciceribacter sp. RN22]|uniref:hypothetical protein n=1 Tax=Ciceribacter sp. RN22 TaxID=2954932 RepID=UPI0020934FBE|nr:hypothetical protein [Ciceribacter sp. RN22]MCO6179957.1 hypothetical protein [Ciceribacter sp. RN22]
MGQSFRFKGNWRSGLEQSTTDENRASRRKVACGGIHPISFGRRRTVQKRDSLKCESFLKPDFQACPAASGLEGSQTHDASE